MRDLTVLRFLQIVLKDNPELQTIKGRQISYIRKELANTCIRPVLTTSEFHVVARIYPNHVRVSETAITIHDGGSLIKTLDNKLIYSKDADMDAKVKAIWKSRKEF